MTSRTDLIPLSTGQNSCRRQRSRPRFALLPMLAVLAFCSVAPPAQATSAGAAHGRPLDSAPGKEDAGEGTPVVTRHTIHVRGVTVDYTATVGKLPIKNDQGDVEAYIFYIAYTTSPASGAAPRPLVFAYNGGPGASSVYLHMGAIGPKRVKMQSEGWMPTPPYQLVDNEDTLLDQADIVFIDPVGTGFSRTVKPELNKKFWGLRGDIDSMTEFIRLYLTRNDRWNSPLFLMGESYGTTRSAGLADSLFDKGIALNGIVLASSVLNFQTLIPTRGNDLPDVLALPSYTAIAWYHKKLPPDLQRDREKTLSEVETWAIGDYAHALAEGDRLTGSQRQAVIDRLARYTGLSKSFVDRSNLRITVGQFCAELLRDENRNIGRYDGRFKGIQGPGAFPRPDFDPSDAAVGPPFSATFSQYIRTELGYKTDLEYYYLNEEVNGAWNWGTGGFGFPETGEALRQAFAKNPYMKLFVAAGLYDLATPYFEAEYALAQMNLDPSVRNQVEMHRYEAGHMMYLLPSAHDKLKSEIEAFLRGAQPSK